MKLHKFARFDLKQLWGYFTNNENVPGNLLQNPEKSWNFVTLEKWKPCKL